ncbi:MAG: SpoIIE family protein phosphatase [Flavobacteriales bacterium]|nr:SpoIIE family protein phosphatase [Flavobacteriales bacterium]
MLDKLRSRLLDRQIRRHLPDVTIPEAMEGFFRIVDEAYSHYEENLNLLERALDLSSRELNDAKAKVTKASAEVNEKNSDLLSSIHYARLIQEAILPSEDRFRNVIPDSFVFHSPRDIVSGDFYWLQEYEGKVLIAAVDCTGHGVPGAFMSIIGNNALNAAVREEGLTTPSLILDYLNETVSDTLRQKTDDTMGIKDGMDIALINLDLGNRTLEYSGAYNPLYIIREGHLLETKGDKFPIGISIDDRLRKFTNHRMEVRTGDVIYIFSDGYPDQFGGSMGKKFKYDNFRSLLFEAHRLPCKEQCALVKERFHQWRGDLMQLDDTLLIGLRIP